MVGPSDIISAEEWAFLRHSLGLSLVQMEIMKRLFASKSYQQIAREMALRPRMVRTVVNGLYRACGVSNRVQLLVYVLTRLREHLQEREGYLSE